MRWWTLRRNRLRFQTFTLSGLWCRVTRRRGKVVMLEIWFGPSDKGAYSYFVRSDL